MTLTPFPLKQTTVDAKTGKVLSEGTANAFLLTATAKPGQCAVCLSEHEPELPHNVQSFPYQYRFFAEHNRWPDWRDAMADCSPEVREKWTAALVDMGIDVEGGKISPTTGAKS